MKVTSINNPICHLAECPIWNDSEKALYWTDILEGRIWRYIPASGVVEVFWQGELQIGGFAFTKDSDMVLCTDKGIFLLRGTGDGDRLSSLAPLFDIPLSPHERFNDITTDPRGRLFAGTLSNRGEPGTVYRLEKGKTPIAVLRNIHCSNGMTFSWDLKYFYHTDSLPRTITRFRYDIESGAISHPRIFYSGREENGLPDGITIDREGCIWVACWGAGKIIRISAEGMILQEIQIPALQVSSLVFGTAGMNRLFITTACEHGVDLKQGLDRHGRFLGGTVYCLGTPVSGRREWPALII